MMQRLNWYRQDGRVHLVRDLGLVTVIGLAFSLAAIVASARLASAQGVLQVGATCPSYPTGHISQGTAVPCSNTVNCMTYSYNDRSCPGDKLVTNYKNTNPPNQWSNCTSVSGPQKSCTETATTCGTIIWYSGPCNDNNECTPTTGVNGQWCKSPNPGS